MVSQIESEYPFEIQDSMQDGKAIGVHKILFRAYVEACQ
jgi:hypothetical protein